MGGVLSAGVGVTAHVVHIVTMTLLAAAVLSTEGGRSKERLHELSHSVF